MTKGFWDTGEADKHRIVPIIHCSSSTLVFFKVKVLRKPELPLRRRYCCEGDRCSLIIFFTHSILLATVHVVGVPGQGSGWSQARQGPTSPTAESSCTGCKAGSYPAWLKWGRIWAPGVRRHPTGGEDTEEGALQPAACASIGCGCSCLLELQGCRGREQSLL